MGRKNIRAAGRGRSQARRDPFAGLPAPIRRSVERMPMVPIAGRCPGPKQRMRYETQQDAQRALTIIQRERRARGHAEAAIEKRAYECEIGGCGGWHLTSREAFSRPPGRRA